MESIPATQTAVTATEDGSLVINESTPVPHLDPDMVIVKNAAVSLNPVDTKMDGLYSCHGAILGCDFAGTVVAVGSEVKNPLQVGDRVSGEVMGMNPLQPAVGAFATYVGAPGDLLLKIPDTVTFESASALGTVFMTTGLALFKSLGLPNTPRNPATKPYPVLVYGGSTATGTAACQLLRLSGLDPIVTCSPHSFELVKSYGAVAAFDYKSPTCAADIRSLTKNSLRYALDCITVQDSMKLCYAAIGRAGGRYTALDPYPEAVAKTRKIITPDWVLGPTMIGKDIAWPPPHTRKANEEDKVFGIQWNTTVQGLLDEGKIRTHPLKVAKGNFSDVLDGLKAIKAGKVRGVKVVISLV